MDTPTVNGAGGSGSGNSAGGAGTNSPRGKPDFVIIDPGAIKRPERAAVRNIDGEPGAGEQPIRRGPGRPPGSGAKQNGGAGGTAKETRKSAALAVDGFAPLLVSAHAMLAAIAKTPELALDDEEAERIAKAAVDVAAQYNVVVNPKAQAWMNLALCMGAVYGPRAIAYGARKKAESMEREPRRERPRPAPVPDNAARPTRGPEPMTGVPTPIVLDDGEMVFSPHIMRAN